jgi:hypothetical protein
MQNHAAEDEIGESSISARHVSLSLVIASFCSSASPLSFAPVIVGENSPLMADVEVFLIRGICLDSKTGCKDELADGCAEAGEEGVEGLWYDDFMSAMVLALRSCSSCAGAMLPEEFGP